MLVKLHPPELGSLSVRVTHGSQGLTSEIQATSENVRSLLQAHLPLLVDALSDAGVRLSSVTVTSDSSFNALMHDSAQGSGRQQYDAPGHTLRQSEGVTGALDMGGVPDVADAAAAAALLTQSMGYSWLA